MPDPHRKAVLDVREGNLLVRQRRNSLIVNQEPIGVLDLEVMGIGGLELNHATFDRILKNHLKREFQ